MRILLADSDPRVQKKLLRVLSDDYIVDVVETGEEAERNTYAFPYDLVLMDLVLPDISGDHLCRLIKARIPHLPIIIISSKATMADKENAFDKGADDYLVKPISTRELKARMKVLIRRSKIDLDSEDILELRDLKFDTKKRQITYKNDRLRLRKKEMQLLEFFMRNQGTILTRGELLEHVWDMNINPFTNTVEVHIKRLREKIEVPYGVRFIETIHGVGYLME